MAEYLLDTNHVSPLVTIGHPLRARVLEAMTGGNKFFVSSANLSEIIYGLVTTARADENLRRWELIYAKLGVLILSAEESIAAGRLQGVLRKQGWQLKTADAQLSIQALVNGLTLLTTDRDFERVGHLPTENWIAFAGRVL